MVRMSGSVSLSISHALWIRWLRLAIEEVAEAESARKDGLRLLEAGEDVTSSVVAESDHGLLAIAAAAFALDGFAAAVRERAVGSETAKAWARNRTPRPRQVIETIKLGCDVGGIGLDWEDKLEGLFALRNRSVHPEETMKEPARHPLGVTMASENVEFGLEAAADAVRFAHQVVSNCLANPSGSVLELSGRFRRTVEGLRPPTPL